MRCAQGRSARGVISRRSFDNLQKGSGFCGAAARSYGGGATCAFVVRSSLFVAMRPDSTISFASYPMAGAACAVAAGIVLAEVVGSTALPVGALLLAVGVALAAGGAWWRARQLVSIGGAVTVAGVALALVGIGTARASGAELLAEAHVAHRAESVGGAPIVLTGRVDAPPTRTPRALRFTVEARALASKALRDSVAVGRVRVARYAGAEGGAGGALPDLEAGDIVRLVGALEAPPRPRNPADFDYGQFLRRKGLWAVFIADSVAVLGRERSAWGSVVARVRGHVAGQIARHVPSADAQAVLGALMLGDRSRIDPAVREQFAQTGLLHLLAVSGLHVLLVALVFYRMLRPTLVRLGASWRAAEIVRTGLTLLLLGLYVAVTGGSASVVRAALMALVLMLGVVLGRRGTALNTLGVAAFVLLAWRPAFLFEAGFQLSFAAVTALVTLGPAIERLVPESAERWLRAGRVRRWVWGSTLATVAATLGTMPVLAWHFGHVGLAGLVLNLPAIPLTFATLASGLLMAVVGGFWSFGAAAFGASADLAATALLGTAERGNATLGWFSLHGYWRSGFGVAAFVLALVALVQWPRPRVRWRCVIAAGVLGLVPVFAPLLDRAPPALDLLFFDIGQGDAALIRTPSGRHVLVDVGDAWKYGEGEAEVRGDSGERTILPHLARYGIRRLDAVVVSHPHRDHFGGLPSLLEAVAENRLEIGRIVHSGAEADTDLFRLIRSETRRLGIPEYAVVRGDTLAVDPAVRFDVLAPARLERAPANLNDASLVLRAQFGETAVLLLGDAEAESEAGLVAAYGAALGADVVKVGHHGSRTSSTPPFVEAVTADSSRADAAWAVVSVAQRNRYGLPDADALVRWHERGAQVVTTAERGAVWLRSDGARVEWVAWR